MPCGAGTQDGACHSLQQAKSWLTIDPEQVAALWNEALERARRLDQLHPELPMFEKKTRESILQQARGNPALERLWQERFAGKS